MKLANKFLKVPRIVEESSGELLERFRCGEAKAADELFHRYVGRLTQLVDRQLNSSLRRRLDPEDAVHSAYRSFFIRAGRGDFVLENSGDLWRLLVTITLNKLRRQIAQHRSAKRNAAKDAGMNFLAVAMTRGPSPLEALAAADELESLMAKLTPWQRTVVRMRLQDHSWAEISAATGKPDRSVRRVIAEARKIWHIDSDSVCLPGQASMTGRMKTRATESAKNTTPVFLKYDDFLLQEMIGHGGTGKVYRAYWKNCHRTVAVKMLRKAEWTSSEAIERFMVESTTISQLKHPHIVGYHGVGRVRGGGIFLVTDFVEGKNLAQVIAGRKPSLIESVNYVALLAKTVDFAHKSGLVHCDLKPENVLVTQSDELILGDFGLATKMNDGSSDRRWAGTPGHMAPEQLDERFGKIGSSTDVFALGLMLLQMITGKKVFIGTRIVQILTQHSQDHDWWSCEEIHLLPKQLLKVLKRSLEIHPSDRLESAAKLAQSLERVLKKLC